MRKLLLLFLAFSLLTSCNNNPFSKNEKKEDARDKDDRNTKDDRDDKDDKNGKNDRDKDDDDNGKSNWTSKQRNKWLNECMDAADNSPRAKEVCSCVLEKMEKKYPDASDVEKASEAEGTRLAKECMAGGGGNEEDNDEDTKNDDDRDNNQGGNWTNLQRKQFIQGCATVARKAQGFTSEQANSYCDCMTRKVERKHTFQEAGRMTSEDFQTEEWQNAAMDCRPRD